MHKHMWRVVRPRCTPKQIAFVCECSMRCEIIRNTYNLLTKGKS